MKILFFGGSQAMLGTLLESGATAQSVLFVTAPPAGSLEIRKKLRPF